MTSTKLQINYNIQKLNDQNSFGHPPAQKVPLVRRAGLVIDIWILFTHKLTNFKGVREITSLSCYLFFEICYLPFACPVGKHDRTGVL